MKIIVAALIVTFVAPIAAAAQQRDFYAEVYEKITTDVSCAPSGCRTLQGWRNEVASWCNRFQSLDAQNNPTIQRDAASNCMAAQAGLSSALVKADSYGFGLFTERS